MNKPRVLLDCDGVIADFASLALGVIYEMTGRRIAACDIKSFDMFGMIPKEYLPAVFAMLSQNGACTAIKPYPGAKEAVAALREVADVYIVTAPWEGSKTWMGERTDWLHDHFGIESKKIVHTHAKYLVRGSVMIDDRDTNLRDWVLQNPAGCPILWESPYNADNKRYWRTNDWNAVIDYIRSTTR